MKIKILYFAGLREALGCSGENLELPPDIATVGQLRDWLVSQGRGKLASVKNLRCAVNQAMTGFDAALGDGDEIAFFPPVTGG
ncbi:MAG: molybdopterin converting factor subunit 1 [Azonexus sp.]|jgi:molybdopterin synthase sulfur carrier subunit|nr:molybdopterin converting factor subunit 1 [Azonexus sp.]